MRSYSHRFTISAICCDYPRNLATREILLCKILRHSIALAQGLWSDRKGGTDGASRLDERPAQGGDRIPTAHPRLRGGRGLSLLASATGREADGRAEASGRCEGDAPPGRAAR